MKGRKRRKGEKPTRVSGATDVCLLCVHSCALCCAGASAAMQSLREELKARHQAHVQQPQQRQVVPSLPPQGWQEHKGEEDASSGYSSKAGFINQQQKKSQLFAGGSGRLDGGDEQEYDNGEDDARGLGEEDKMITCS